jgi:hypothetical protein
LCAVPLVGLLELALHVKQTGPDVVTDDEWNQAAALVKPEVKPDDLVIFEPFWADPLGRRAFGDPIATMKREGYSDVARFPRAFEVSIRGFHDPELAAWKKVKEDHAGKITITLLENPAPQVVIDDLVDLVTPDRLSVSVGEAPCTFQRGATAGGSTVVPQGLLTPADKFVCAGGHVGVAVLHALDHHPHLCIYATPSNGTLRMRWKDVQFGPRIVGHSGQQWVSERSGTGEKLEMRFFAGPAGTELLSSVYHASGAGWTGFELPTGDLDGKKSDLVVELDPSTQKQFCFEASTRK